MDASDSLAFLTAETGLPGLATLRRVLGIAADPLCSPPFHDSEAVLSKKEIRANCDCIAGTECGLSLPRTRWSG
jgi:hypothetical protein